MKFLLRTLDFFILPFLFFVIVSVFFRLMVFMRGIIRLRFRDIFFLFIGIYTRFLILFSFHGLLIVCMCCF